MKYLIIMMSLLSATAFANYKDAYLKVAADQIKYTGTYLLCESIEQLGEARHTRTRLAHVMNNRIKEISGVLNQGENPRHESDFTMVESKDLKFHSAGSACVVLNKVTKK